MSGFLILLLAFILGNTGVGIIHFYGALILLGLGWNFSYIGSSSLVDRAAKGKERGLILGVNETLVAISSSLASFMGGVALSIYGWMPLSSIGIFMPVARLLQEPF